MKTPTPERSVEEIVEEAHFAGDLHTLDDKITFYKELLQTERQKREEMRYELHQKISELGTYVYEEMKEAIYKQHGLPETRFAMLNGEQINHIIYGIVSNYATRMNKAITQPNNPK